MSPLLSTVKLSLSNCNAATAKDFINHLEFADIVFATFDCKIGLLKEPDNLHVIRLLDMKFAENGSYAIKTLIV